MKYQTTHRNQRNHGRGVDAVFESFLDDVFDEIGKEQKTSSQKLVDVISTTTERPDAFPFMLQMQFNHIGPASRTSQDDFMARLQVFNSELTELLPMCSLIEEISRPTYMLMNDKWNNDWSRRNEDYIEEFDYEGLHFYNEPGKEKQLTKVSQFDVSVGVSFVGLRYNNLLMLVKQLRRIFETSIKNSFPEAKFADIAIFDNRTGIKKAKAAMVTRMDVQRMKDFENRLSTKSTKEAFKRLQMTLMDYGHQEQINKIFDTQKQRWSDFAQMIMKKLNIDEKKFIVSETPETVFITVPKDEKLKINMWEARQILELMHKNKRYLLLTIEGKLALSCYWMIERNENYSEQRVFEKFLEKCIFSNIHQLDIKMEFVSKDYVIDLSKFYIDDFRIKFVQRPYKYDHRLGRREYEKDWHQPKIVFIQRPKKMKIIDKTNET